MQAGVIHYALCCEIDAPLPCKYCLFPCQIRKHAITKRDAVSFAQYRTFYNLFEKKGFILNRLYSGFHTTLNSKSIYYLKINVILFLVFLFLISIIKSHSFSNIDLVGLFRNFVRNVCYDIQIIINLLNIITWGHFGTIAVL